MRSLREHLRRESTPSLLEAWESGSTPLARDWHDTHIARMVRSTHPEWEKAHPKEWAKAEHPDRQFTVAKLKNKPKPGVAYPSKDGGSKYVASEIGPGQKSNLARIAAIEAKKNK